jgi:sulfur relay (sulfurtransferase) complex TusBCD TusD component (DsrE family)
MVGRKTLAILLSFAPYGNQYADHMSRVALRVLEKGYSVEIFLVGDGVHEQMSGRVPNDFFSVGTKISELIGRGARVYSCQICSMERGYGAGGIASAVREDNTSTNVPEGVQLISMTVFIEKLARADKAISFGGG